MRILTIIIVAFVISCSTVSVKKDDMQEPPLSKKEKEVLMLLLETGATVGGAIIDGSIKNGLIYEIIK